MYCRSVARVEVQQLKADQRQQLRQMLAGVVQKFSSQAEVLSFLTSFFTPSELIVFGRRLEIAQELLQGTTGEDIVRKLRVGYSTISFIDSALRRDLPDYRSTIPALLNKQPQVIRRGIERLKRRAPVLAALLELTQQQSKKS